VEGRTGDERKHAERHQQRMRAAIFIVIVALVLGAAGYVFFAAFWSPHLVK